MKIEKLNDNQIRCILDKSDLDQRQLQLSELAYGSAKAKELFRDMMEQAEMEFGFETGDNIPLMIEAIPVSPECLILVVTKVEDPEELDTRFSRFSNLTGEEDGEDFMTLEDVDIETLEELPFHPEQDEEDMDSMKEDASKDGTDIMAPFNKAIAHAKEEIRKKKKEVEQSKMLSDEIYIFPSLDTVITVCGYLSAFYRGESILYKDTLEEEYYLMLLKEDLEENLYQRACNICSEHGEGITVSYGAPSYFKEHFQLICDGHAVEILSQFN